MSRPPSLTKLTSSDKDWLIHLLWHQVEDLKRENAVLAGRVSELETRLKEPAKTPDNSSVPPSKGEKPNRPKTEKKKGPRRGSLGRASGGRPLAENPGQFVIAKATRCAHCQTGLGDADQTLHGRYDKIDLPPVRPVVTWVERYVGHCPCCGGDTLAPVPEGMEDGSPFGLSILAVALYLRFVHAVSYRRLTRLMLHLFALAISEGALDAMFQRAKLKFDDEVMAILARLRRCRIVCSNET